MPLEPLGVVLYGRAAYVRAHAHRFSFQTVGFFDGRIHVVVACHVIGTAGTTLKLTSTWKLVIDGSVVVAGFFNQTSAHKARAIVKTGIRIEPWVGRIGAASDFFVVANAIAVGVRVTVTTTNAQGI